MNKLGIFLIAAVQLCAVTALPASCACARNLRPVCGSDGKTYNNQCLLYCERDKSNSELTIVRDGPCEESADPCICTYEYSPVCGTDGTSYPNKCALRCARSITPGLSMKHRGECQDVKVAELPHPCTCTREFKQVCGNDGVTYGNPCLLNCATQMDSRLSVEHTGPCDNSVKVVEQPNEADKVIIVDNNTPSSCACTRKLEPVCASDGVTYNNECIMRCHGGHHLSVITHEPCDI